MDSKEKKENQTPGKKFNWAYFMVALAAVLIICAAIFFINNSRNSQKQKNEAEEKLQKDAELDVAFYLISEQVENLLKEKINQQFEGQINFTDLQEADVTSQKIEEKYNLFFAFDGQVAQELSPLARNLPESVSGRLPSKIRRSDNKILPVLLDHWEIDYRMDLVEEHNVLETGLLSDFVLLLEEMKSKVFVPLFVAGNEDDTLLAFVSALVETTYGSQEYKKLVDCCKKEKSLKNIIDVNLSENHDEPSTLRLVLDTIRYWQDEGLLYSKWYTAKRSDLIQIAEQNQLGVFFTSLTKHRQLPYSVNYYFTSDRIPVFSGKAKHGLIAPSIVCLNFSESDKFDSLVESFVESDFQRTLSEKTMLAPVASMAQAFDRPADDVRLLAAACPEGQLADLSDAAFQKNRENIAQFASEIRDYVKSGIVR